MRYGLVHRVMLGHTVIDPVRSVGHLKGEIVKQGRKILGYLLFGLGFLILWPLQIGIGLYGLYFIIMIFIEGNILAGIISIFAVGFGVWLIRLIIGIASMPYVALVSWLLEREEPA